MHGVFFIPSLENEINWWIGETQVRIPSQTFEPPKTAEDIEAIGRNMNFGYKKAKVAYKFGLVKRINEDGIKVSTESS